MTSGLDALLAVFRELLDRPRWWRRPDKSIRGDRPLPMICLIKKSPEAADRGVLGVLARGLDCDSPHRILFARVDAEGAAERCAQWWAPVRQKEAAPLLPLLDELSTQLQRNEFRRNRMRSFRHYGLVDWLSAQSLAPGDSGHKDMFRRLQDWYRQPVDQSENRPPPSGFDGALPQSSWLLTLLAVWHRPVRVWLWCLLGREPKWLMRQPYMVPGHSTSFVGFAERLTRSGRSEESSEQLEKLLVHAFLQDLRAEYRPRGMRLRRWRRTSYVPVLLDNVSRENGGWRLLQLINDIRNESTEHDPLLIVATVAEKPADMPVSVSVDKAQEAFKAWGERLPAQRETLRPDARFIFLQLSGSEGDGENPPVVFEARRPPLLARKLVFVPLVVAVLTATVLVGGDGLYVRWRHDCLPSFSPGVELRWLNDTKACVGYSDNPARVFGGDVRLVAAQRAVFEHNEIARRLREENPQRPLVTLVYFADLSHSAASPGTDSSLAEELEGLLLRQRQQNHKDQWKPLLRVIVANGGDRMAGAVTVVEELLTPLVQDDPTVLGVVGMGLTVPETERAIAVLGDLGVPVVTTTLTSESLPGLSPLYFQMAPGNRVQAQLLAAYAAHLGRAVTVYHPPLTDGYLRSLVNESREAVGADRVRLREWVQRVAEVDVVCGTDQLAFFVGRESDFPAFLNEVVRRCDTNQPLVVGSDTVSRFVAQSDQRRRDEFSGVAVSFVSLGSRIVLAGPSCQADGKQPGSSHTLTTFCAAYRGFRGARGVEEAATAEFARVLSPGGEHVPWPGERVGLMYDAGGLFLEAVRRNQLRFQGVERGVVSPHRAAIGQELRELSPFEGASGPVDFGVTRTGVTRTVSILRLPDLHDLARVPSCVFMIRASADGARPWVSPAC